MNTFINYFISLIVQNVIMERGATIENMNDQQFSNNYVWDFKDFIEVSGRKDFQGRVGEY